MEGAAKGRSPHLLFGLPRASFPLTGPYSRDLLPPKDVVTFISNLGKKLKRL